MSEYAVDESTIFETPLVELDLGLHSDATVYAKAEWYNLYDAPHGGGSVKSRIAKGMLDGAEERGDLEPGVTVIEPTSGNTGSEIARLASARGYNVEIVMPDNAAGGKVEAVRDAGAEIHFVDADLGYDAVIERCEEIVAADPDRYYRPNQYENPDNPDTHERTTAREVWAATDGEVTHFVAGVGTGGTVTGTGRGLTDLSDGDVEIVGFEPDEQLHAIDGLKYLKTGDHYHPETYDESVLDRTEYVATGDAYDRARALCDRYQDAEVPIADRGQHDLETVREHLRVDDQFVVGTSAGAGAAVVAALDEADELADDDVVVFMLCDRGDKYADIPLWEDYL
ncbi:pyridoxal-phosphate dependent enzyme [Halorubrum sp. CBA1125]|uniref:PLP-dependent cysteine synthase family protein n=1 Tax=Halorubrum sp. CBA1125 TaxID=2668072 RepID=UPI0012E92908|nr:pyridoxal-phosphate dependent enzyme [Halorubrum sp. CBA1125]MUW15190.1 pyridoxal-phosphate dependent enzyme [Halorubrum sp. CBA1125]